MRKKRCNYNTIIIMMRNYYCYLFLSTQELRTCAQEMAQLLSELLRAGYVHPPTEHACDVPRPAGGGGEGGGGGGGGGSGLARVGELDRGRASEKEGSPGTEWGPDLKLLASAFREQFGRLFQVQEDGVVEQEEGVGEQPQAKSSIGPVAQGWQDLAAAARRAACALIREEFVILSRLVLQHPLSCVRVHD